MIKSKNSRYRSVISTVPIPKMSGRRRVKGDTDEGRGYNQISERMLLNCEQQDGSWQCPVMTCQKYLSRKQTLQNHLATHHAVSCENPSKRYKLYEIDESVPIPRTTRYLMEKQTRENESTINTGEAASPLGTQGEILEVMATSTCEDATTSREPVIELVSDGCNAQVSPKNSFNDDCFEPDNSDMDIASDSINDDMVISSDDESEITDLEDSCVGVCNSEGASYSTEDPPLYVIPSSPDLWSSSMSKNQHHLAVSAFATRHNLSDTGIKHLLELIQIHIPKQNIGESNVNKVKEQCGFNNSCLTYHYYCDYCKKLFSADVDSCQTPGCKGTKLDSRCKKYFLTSDLKMQVREVLERDGIWQSINASFMNKQSSDNVSDIKSGFAYKKLRMSGGFLHEECNITFSLFTDGVPLFKSSCVSLWPVYLLINEIPPRERFLRKNMLLWGVWQGVGKPNMNMFFRPLVMDLSDLYHNGVTFTIGTEVKQTKAMLIVATMDLPARAGVLNMTQHNGTNGCLYCMEPGQSVPSGKGHCRAYPVREKIPDKRTHFSAKASSEAARKNGKRKDGFLGESILLYLPQFSLVENVVLDYMHGILLGVAKKFLELWFDSKNSKEPYYIGQHITDIDKQLRAIHPPYMIHRHPRILSNTYHHWKASELRNWLLFYSIPCLLHRLPDVYLTHFSCLVEATYILLGEGITPGDLIRADTLLNTFVKNVQTLYHMRIMGINVHNLTHLVECVRLWGPLWGFSCFAFESFNGELKRSIHGTGNVCKQMFWSLQAQKRIEQKAKGLRDGDTKSYLKDMVGEPVRLAAKSEAYQCYVGKVTSVSETLSVEVESELLQLTGTGQAGKFMFASKISRNGFIMYSSSSNKVKRQNSFTILLERPVEDVNTAIHAIEVKRYIVHKESLKVFAVGKAMQINGCILPRRLSHLKKLCYIGHGQKTVKAENLREPLVIVRRGGDLYGGALPNHFERD